ncbi:hypothetical protein EGT07_00420 [Herbaspirillum sp. HC18]|nr:hypothetical protein EGT07_00420 [Herbaspirillum sp. HC18]
MSSINNERLLSIPFLCALVACSGGGSSNASTGAHVAGTSSSTAANFRIINNEDMMPGLKAIDADSNRIRDDIDRLIAAKYAETPAMKKAAQQEAQALQKNLEATTRKEAITAGDEMMRANSCTYKIFPHSTSQDVKFREQMQNEIEALTANTKERFTAYWKAEELSSGAVFSQPEEPVCD